MAGEGKFLSPTPRKILNLDPLRLLRMHSGTRLLFNTCDKTPYSISRFLGREGIPAPPPLCMKSCPILTGYTIGMIKDM